MSLRALHVRLTNVVRRAMLRSSDDSTKMQSIAVDYSDDEVSTEVERPQPYGFTSRPLDGAEVVILCVNGRGDHELAIVVDDRRYRLKNLEQGEVALYTDQGDSITIKRGGTIVINAATAVEITGNTSHVAKGEQLNTAVANLGTAIAGALTTMGALTTTPMVGALAVTAGTTINTAITAFNTAAHNALSTKVKLS